MAPKTCGFGLLFFHNCLITSCFVGFIYLFASYDLIVCILKIVSKHCLLLKQVERAFSVCGTIEYMAPEIVEGGESGHDKVLLAAEIVPLVPRRLKLKLRAFLPFRRWTGGASAC